MKKMTLVACALIVSVASHAQTETKSEKKEIRKEVKMEDNDGVKTLTITTTTAGVVTNEVYTGAEADAKLKELEGNVKNEKTTQDVDVTIENGVKTVKIKKNVDGKVTEEVYTGADADKKLKEMELDPSTKEAQRKEERRIEIKETHNE